MLIVGIFCLDEPQSHFFKVLKLTFMYFHYWEDLFAVALELKDSSHCGSVLPFTLEFDKHLVVLLNDVLVVLSWKILD